MAPPVKRFNADVRTREYLTPDEVTRVEQAALGVGRHGKRDAAMIAIAYRYGLRAAELCGLKWTQVDLGAKTIHIVRVKRGTPSVHPISGPGLTALKGLPRVNSHVFTNERGGPMSESSFHKIVARAGVLAKLPFPIHPHMLRHSAGYRLINDGIDVRTIQAFLGHCNINHTVRYTALNTKRFIGIWKD